ncbi:Rho termination factor N-terminal domain-containing protein [Paenibacillus sp. BR1-192]|uniref:Rho termination factor N-terminal domain-containing protein n=1 Tax=Paenibacillus sp. BR1-192 TaxID=3032287 RepID=UPI00240DF3F5|nr:Rho termination factor N-terminal domain-containing protein [Paenibacillus sp. BR1-192]WFB57475.1 Rho termination factor N-terminal domain-containing protein [Paenibacillus sp. BR1-192]
MPKVLKDFRDRHTRKIYRADNDYDVTNEDYLKHLQNLGYVEVDLEDMTKEELLDYAKAKEIGGVNATMKKADILETIKAVP